MAQCFGGVEPRIEFVFLDWNGPYAAAIATQLVDHESP